MGQEGELEERAPTPAEAAQALQNSVARLQEAARKSASGDLRVIARLSLAAVRASGGAAPGRNDRGAFERAPLDMPLPQIEAAQQAVLARMTSAGAGSGKGLYHLPMVAMVVDPALLDELVSTGEVVSLSEDRIARPQLAASGRIIGARQAAILGATGKGATVAVLDTGVDATHPFLAGRVLNGACFSTNSGFLSALFTGFVSRTLCPDGSESSTAPTAGERCPYHSLNDGKHCEHGTAVAGVLAGRRTAAFGDANGIAPDAKILPIQVNSRIEWNLFVDADCSRAHPCLGIFESDVTQGLQYVRENAARLNIVAANLSLHVYNYDGESSACNGGVLAEVISALYTMGIPTVVASGNDGEDGSVSEPACVTKAVTVGATDGDKLATFSNHAWLVDILAPGARIKTSWGGPPLNPEEGAGIKVFEIVQGTSFAAPHVSGAIAVLREKLPTLTLPDLVNLMKNTGTGITDPRNNPGRRQVDICAALRAQLREAQFPAWANDPKVQVVSGDFDADGLIDDLAMTGGSGWNMIAVAYRQANGTFTFSFQVVADFPGWAQTAGAKIVSGDFDADGRIDDIAMTGGAGWSSIPVAYGQAGGNFTITNQVVANFPTWAQDVTSKVVSGDFDGDGRIDDIALVGAGAETIVTAFAPGTGDAGGLLTTIAVAFGQGAGNFTVTREPAGNFGRLARQANVRTVSGDFDGDARVDDIALVLGAGWINVPVALGQSPGKFTLVNQTIADVPQSFNANQKPSDQSIAFDFDGDGWRDDLAIIGESRRDLEVYRGIGSGNFRYASVPFKDDLARTPSHAGFSQAAGARPLAVNLDGDNLLDDLALVGGADWCHIPVHVGPAQGGNAINPGGGGVLEQ